MTPKSELSRNIDINTNISCSKYRDPSDRSKSLIISPVPQQMYCITCTLCKKLYIGETGRRLGDRFREHLRDVEKDDQNASKPIASVVTERVLYIRRHERRHIYQ